MMAVTTQVQLGIAELAERAGVTQRTIRYYVSEGLLPPPAGQGQRRAYNEEHLQQLERIQHLKSAYLPLHEIRRRLSAPAQAAASAQDAVSAVACRADERSVTVPPSDQYARADGTVLTSPAAEIRRGALGFGPSAEVGRIEIYEPVESVWRRHTIRPGVELHFQETDDSALTEAIQRLIREAGRILDGEKKTGSHRA